MKSTQSKKLFNNSYRSRMNIKDYSLLLEHMSGKKRLAIKISNSLTLISDAIQVINRLKILDYLKLNHFGTKIRFFNHISIRLFLIFEAFCIGKTLISLKDDFYSSYKSYKDINFDKYKDIPDSIFKISSIYFIGRLFNFYSPKLLFTFILIDLSMKYISKKEKNMLANINNNSSTYLTVQNNSNDYFQYLALKNNNILNISNLKLIEFEDIQLSKLLLSYSIIKTLDLLIKDNLKTAYKIPIFNTKHLKVFLILYAIGKFTNWLGLLGYSSVDFHTTEGLIISLCNLIAINKYYLLGFFPLYLFNFYSLFIYSSTKNRLNENYLNENYYVKNRIERYYIMLKFHLINMYFYSRKIYY